jgi:transposase
MQSEIHTLKINTSKVLPIGFDVGKSNLDFFLEIPQPDSSEVKAFSGKIANRNQAILTALEQLFSLAIQNGFENIGVLCESTGPYSDKLLRLARQMGHFTAYINGEAVHKLKVLENNDAGKTDIKDPRVILMVAKMDKILLHRPLRDC